MKNQRVTLCVVFNIDRAIQLSCDCEHRGFSHYKTVTKIISVNDRAASIEDGIVRVTRGIEGEFAALNIQDSLRAVRSIGVEDEIPPVFHYRVTVDKIQRI